jgi:hypothetical protein
VNPTFAPWVTTIIPDGEIVPPGDAVAVMVNELKVKNA